MEGTREFNPYQAPAAKLLSERFAPEDITHYKAYVGSKNTYFLKHWFKLRQGISEETGFNFAALFYGPLWFLYRKMYLNFALITMILMIEGLVEYYVFNLSPFQFDTILSISNAFGLVLSILCASYANKLYYYHVTAKIKKARRSEFENQSIIKRLKRTGGTDCLGPLTLVVALVLALYAIITLNLM